MQIAASLPAIARPLSLARLGRNRMVLGAVALGVITAAITWQWSWLVAIGVAPLLLGVAPCAAMCGLGLCVHRIGGRACSTTAQGEQSVPVTPATHASTQET